MGIVSRRWLMMHLLGLVGKCALIGGDVAFVTVVVLNLFGLAYAPDREEDK